MMRDASPVLSLSPTFNSYSSSNLAEIAARVAEEFRDDEIEVEESFGSFCGGNFDDDYCLGGGECFYEEFKNHVKEEKIEKVEDGARNGQLQHKGEEQQEEEVDNSDEEFEFAFVSRDSVSSPTPADEIFYNGQIRPIYPLFDTSLLYADGNERGKEIEDLSYDKSMQKPPAPPPRPVRLPLRKLFIEERETSSSCSSSEADELEGVSPETYCVWNPKGADVEVPAKGQSCKKSNSTGSSKRWKFRDLLLHRSSSDGKDRFVFLNHSNSNSHHHGSINAKKKEEKVEKKFDKNAEAATAKAKVAYKTQAAAQHQQCGKNGGERRRESYLPYRQDLMGIFSNVNGLNRNLLP